MSPFKRQLTQHFASLGPDFGSEVQPQPLNAPQLIHVNQQLSQKLGLDSEVNWLALNAEQSPIPFASVYSGHQFGTWAGQLGDGRALLLGELSGMEIQLKGSGITPYSRFGDGRAVLRSTVREYLASEALHHLGVPSTRALAIIGSDTPVIRETKETAALLVRCSQSHIRFGHFEHFFHRQHTDSMRQLADYVIQHYYPQCLDSAYLSSLELTKGCSPEQAPYMAFLIQVVRRTASLIAHWQALGFVHGVLNTDNMSIVGNSLDFGPYGFIEAYDPHWVCNQSDSLGHYAFSRQPSIGHWNLQALLHCFSSLLESQQLSHILALYEPCYWRHYYRSMALKLGFIPEKVVFAEGEGDQLVTPFGLIVQQLLHSLLDSMEQRQLDYSRCFRQLAVIFKRPQQLKALGLTEDWLQSYRTLIETQFTDISQWERQMQKSNPKYILRNYMAHIAIQAAEQQDYQPLNEISALLSNPWDEHPDYEHYAGEPPAWANQLELSCSS